MKNSTDGFLVGRLKSFRFAFKGAFLLLTTEHAIISQVFLALAFIVAGFLTGITKTEWMFQVFAIGLLLSVEGLNTAVEKLCDFIHPNHHNKIGFIKDIAAGAVTFAALSTFTIVVLIYFPYLYEKVF